MASIQPPTASNAVVLLLLLQAALHRYLCEAVPGFPRDAALHVLQFAHGQSNPTYLLKVS